MSEKRNEYLYNFLKEKIQNDKNIELRLKNYYLPIYFWIYNSLIKSSGVDRPFIVGINAPQGAGKTTLTHYLSLLLQEEGISSVAISIDDFYLKRVDQVALAEKNKSCKFLQQRGYPGTHDIQMGQSILRSLKEINKFQGTVKIPRYDKSAYNGRGDRCLEKSWCHVHSPLDVVFLEGWMLGFTSLSGLGKDDEFYEVNAFLDHYISWYRLLNSFVHIYTEDPKVVLDWRLEAEQKMKASGLSGMSDKEVRAYAEKFIPAYERYVPNLLKKPIHPQHLKVKIDKKRLPLLIK